MPSTDTLARRAAGWGETSWCRGTCITACYDADVPRTIQIRDLDDEVYAALSRRAAEAGISVPELLRREAARLAARPSMDDWLRRTRTRSTQIPTTEVLDAIDAWRGEWPDARR